MATISPWRIALMSVALVAATVALAAQFRASLARTPTTQAELDIVRGGKRPMDKHGMPRIYLKSEAYYETRSGMVNLYKACGKSVDSGLKVQVWGAFSGATAISVIGGQRVRVRFPSELPPAYLGANGSFADEDEGVFNPAAANVVFDRDVSELSWWQKQWLVWQIRRSGVLALPYSIPAESVVLDGSDAYIVICDRGLRYDYSRSLDHENVEPALKRILKAVGAI